MQIEQRYVLVPVEPTPEDIARVVQMVEVSERDMALGAEAMKHAPSVSPEHRRNGLIACAEIVRDWRNLAMIAARPAVGEDVVERAFLAVMNAQDRELSLPLTAFTERNLLKRRIAVAIAAMGSADMGKEGESQ